MACSASRLIQLGLDTDMAWAAWASVHCAAQRKGAALQLVADYMASA